MLDLLLSKIQGILRPANMPFRSWGFRHVESESKRGVRKLYPEPCEELRRWLHWFYGWESLPYQALSTQVSSTWLLQAPTSRSKVSTLRKQDRQHTAVTKKHPEKSKTSARGLSGRR